MNGMSLIENVQKVKVNYEQIKTANEEIQSMKLGNKDYAPVNERIKAYRKVYPTGRIFTEIEREEEEYIRIKASVTDEKGDILGVGRASEKKTEKGINALRQLENCETSAVGRALGFAGFGVDTSIASADDMEKVQEENSMFAISKRFKIRISDAIQQARLTINEIYKKMGMRVQDIDDILQERFWTTLKDMNVNQLLKLEKELKGANMKESSWHKIYNQNTKAKDVVPENQQLLYKSTWRRFGEIALNMCGTDELKRQEVIDEYSEMEIDLGNSYE